MTDPTQKPAPILGHKNARLTPEQWSEVILLWRGGNVTLRGLSEKFGVATSTLQEKFNRVGAKKGELLAKQAAAAEAALTIDAEEMARRIFDTKNDTYRLLNMLRRQVATSFVDAKKNGTPISALKHDMQAIRAAADAVATCRREAYIVLGIREDEEGNDELPELLIRGLEPDEVDILSQRAVDDATLAIEQVDHEEDIERAARLAAGEDPDGEDVDDPQGV